MKWRLLIVTVCLSLHGYEVWATQRHVEDHENEIPYKRSHHRNAGPPDHNKLVEMARYVMHNCDWASIATISTQTGIAGFPFTNVKSIVDGSMANSTGMPYFYMSPLDFTARDLAKNTRATVLVSLEETRYCESQKWDPEDPRCTRLMLSGKMKKVKEGTPEYTFAKAALFERHPAMAHFPPDHNWFVAKMKIAQIAMVDWFGGAKYVSVKDYLAYNYTGKEVLDMCAAPGSKTAQLIEFLHADEDKVPSGFVMANDVDNSRCYMLVHQAKRLNSPCILITNHDSALMPALVTTDDKDPTKTKPLKFDRILCDVPCSGDATLRKNPDIWLKWSTGNGNNLHGIQYRVLRRGCELLEIGGRLVYSTCSFNPVENEAVVHRLLQETGDSVKLVDVSDMLPGLNFHKGMTHWRPASKDMVFYDKFEDVPEKWQTVVRPQMFPPKEEDLAKYNLDKCIRILPHHQDTGGFFVAVFEKTGLLPWEKTAEEKTETETETEIKEDKREPPKKRRRMGGYREDPFVFFSGDDEDVFPSIKEYYDLKEDFDSKCLLTRCYVGKKKNIYLVSSIVKDIVQKNEANLKIINTGVKTFVRCDNKNMTCPFRLSQEGLQSILQYIGSKRKVNILKEDLILVLQNDNPSNPPHINLFSEHTQSLVKDLATGSCVLEYQEKESNLKLTLVGWRGVHSLRAYTATPDTVHYLRLLGADYSKYDVNKFKKASDVADDVTDTNDVTEPRSIKTEPDVTKSQAIKTEPDVTKSQSIKTESDVTEPQSIKTEPNGDKNNGDIAAQSNMDTA